MKKFLLSSLVVIASVIYVFSQQVGNRSKQSIALTPRTPETSQNIGGNASSNTKNSNSSSSYKDGEYVGNPADAYYGNIQVKAVIQNGRISDVQFLDYPKDRRTSIAINSDAMSVLKSEAISAQNAKVDIVSGATDTSQAFQESLSSALQQAQNI